MTHSFPRIPRDQATALLRWSEFVLRTGSKGPMLTTQDDRGRVMHVPVQATSAGHLRLAPPKRRLGRTPKATKLREVLSQGDLPTDELWLALNAALSDQTRGVRERLATRHDLHFRSLEEALVAYRDHGSDLAIWQAAARHVSMYVEAANEAEIRRQAAELGSNVAHWLDGLFAPTFTATDITDPSFPWAIVPLKSNSFVSASTPPVLHTHTDGKWTSSTMSGLPGSWRKGFALGDGFLAERDRGTQQVWQKVGGVWQSANIAVVTGTYATIVLGNGILLLPHDKKTNDPKAARPAVEVVLESGGATNQRTWHWALPHTNAALAIDDTSFIVSCDAGLHHVTRREDGAWTNKRLSRRSARRIAKTGEGTFATYQAEEIVFWRRANGSWSETAVPVDKNVTEMWGHGEGLISRHRSEGLLRLWECKANTWQWRQIPVSAFDIRELQSVGHSFVIRDNKGRVRVWSPAAPCIDLASRPSDLTDIETALQAQRLHTARELWHAGKRPEEATVLAAAENAEAPLACLARTLDVRSAAGDTLVGLALKQGHTDSATTHLLRGVQCDPADIDYALTHPHVSVLGALLARGLLAVNDPRLLRLPEDITTWLVLQTFAMGFSVPGARLIERGFPIFPATVDVQAPANITASKRLFAALSDKPYHLMQALMQAPEGLRTLIGADVAKLAVELAGDAATRPLLRHLTALPGVPWHQSLWESQPQDASTLHTLREYGLPSFALARIAASRPWTDRTVRPLSTSRRLWLSQERPKPRYRHYIAADRQKIDADSAKTCEEMVQCLAQPACDWRAALRVRFAGEPGIDGGGLLYEWFAIAIKTLFATERGAFVAAGQAAYLTINPDQSDAARERHLLAAGRLVGHCLAQGYPMGLRLAPSLVSMMTGRVPSVERLVETDPHLGWLPTMLAAPGDDDSGLTFNAPDGTPLTVHGDRIAVTSSNKQAFAQALGAYLPNSEVFLRGVFDVIPGRLLEKLSVQELSELITGTPTIDKAKFLRSISYNIARPHRLITMFEEIVNKYDETELKRLLFLVTNLIAAPAEGFQNLRVSVKFSLKVTMPRSHTCAYALDMPVTEDVATMRRAMDWFMHQDVAYGRV